MSCSSIIALAIAMADTPAAAQRKPGTETGVVKNAAPLIRDKRARGHAAAVGSGSVPELRRLLVTALLATAPAALLAAALLAIN